MKIFHYSNNPSLTVIDPQYYGSQNPGAEKSRASLPNWLPRSFYFTGHYFSEVGSGSHLYTATIPAEKLYDAEEDSLGIIANFPGKPSKKRANNWEKKLAELGYLGYITYMPKCNLIQVFVALTAKRV